MGIIGLINKFILLYDVWFILYFVGKVKGIGNYIFIFIILFMFVVNKLWFEIIMYMVCFFFIKYIFEEIFFKYYEYEFV